jgi:hypothetical protein
MERHCGYVITLDQDLREEDARATLTALQMIKGVISVEPLILDIHHLLAREKADEIWRERIRSLLRRGNEPRTP